MPAANFVKFFVADEPGTSSLLASALDPQPEHQGQRQFRERFCERLRSAGVDLSPDSGPQAVRLEYLSVDLVMAWGDWILLLENKVAAASITRNQLKREYHIALKEMERGTLMDLADCRNKRICVIYLTPTDSTGTVEFNSLELHSERQDAKVHLSWKTVLDDLRQAFPEGTSDDLLGAFIWSGCQLTEQIMANRSIPVVEETLEREAIRDFMKEVRGKIRDMMRSDSTLKLTDWHGPRRERLFGHIGGDHGNVYLDVLADGTDLMDEYHSRVRGCVSFKVAGKSSRTRQKEFCSFSLDSWTRILGFGPDDQVGIDRDRCEFRFENDWEGQAADLADQLAALFCRFLLVFRPFMVNQRAVQVPSDAIP